MSVHRHAGPVDAVLTMERRAVAAGVARYRRAALVVRVSGRVVAADRRLCDAGRCGPGSKLSLELRNVADGPPAEALVDVYTGGAHCCFQSFVALVDGAGRGRVLFRDWADAGYRLEAHAGAHDFVTADDRFAYAFSAFAGSALPVQVFAIAGGRFADVTSTRLDLVRAEANRFRRGYVSQRGKAGADVRGVLAGWCADEYRLGLAAACRAELARALRHGWLGGPPGWPRNAAYVSALERRLAAWGY